MVLVLLVVLLYYWWCKYSWSCPDNGCSHHLPSNALNLVNTPSQCHRHHHVHNNKKNAILDGCSTVDSTLDYDGIRWYSMVFNGIQWYLMVFDGIQWYCMVFACIAGYYMVFDSIQLYSMVLHGIRWYCRLLDGIQ